MSGSCDLVSSANLLGGINFTYVSDRFNNPNSAVYLNQGYLQVPKGVYFSGDFTITAWIQLKAYQNFSVIVYFGNGASKESIIFGMDSTSQGVMGAVINQPAIAYLSTPNITQLNEWYHVAFTLSGKIGSIYVNGLLRSRVTLNTINSVQRINNFIGTNGFGTSYASAVYDDLKIYVGAMTDYQILNDYNVSSTNGIKKN